MTKVFASADRTPAPKPPPEIFQKVTYAAPLGPQVAYVSPATKGARRPAIVWIAGGFDWGIGSIFWEPAPRANDQTAAAFREAGIVLMLPSLRGANENPGKSECMLGEVDDIIAAVKYLEGRKDVDPKRIYLGGHSTGGTLALLAAEKAARFRAVFSFGPIDNPRGYGEICGTQGLLEEEAYVRAPIEFAEHITSPTWVIEGADGNTRAGKAIAIFAKDNLRFIEVPGADHFTVLRPGSEAVARAILADKEPDMNLRIEAADIKAAMTRSPR